MSVTAEVNQNTQAWISVCKVSDLFTGVGVCALIDDEQVAIFKVPSKISADNNSGNTAEYVTIHAIGNYDPKGKAYVLSRGVVGDVKGEPVVASPLYKQHYSLLSGRCLEDGTLSVPVYSVQITDGQVFILLQEPETS